MCGAILSRLPGPGAGKYNGTAENPRRGPPSKRETCKRCGVARLKGAQAMTKHERRMARKPATKFPNLRKKLHKGKIQSRQAKKK
jgi:hypothetical protein